jgi:hypothetical protein
LGEESDLLDTNGWKRFKLIAKRQKKFTRMDNQAKLRSYNSAPKYKNGYEVPQTFDQAMKLDENNGNTLSRLSSARSMNKTFSSLKDITPRQNHLLAIRRFEYISSLMSSTMADTKPGLWLTDILPIFRRNKSIQEWLACVVSAWFSSSLS